MDPDEVEFLGEKQYIAITPLFSSKVISLISGDVGPFRAGWAARVPLWMAINLKQQQKCKLLPPDWMQVEFLENIREEEKNSQNFIKMPSEHYMVEAKLILGCAPDDVPRADEVRTIIKDIWDIRMSKLRSSVDALIKNSGSYAAVDHLTEMEINTVRPILPHALDQLHRMKRGEEYAGSQQQSTSTFITDSTSTI